MEAFEELVGLIASVPKQPPYEDILTAICEREELRVTSLGEGIAIPHCKGPRIGSYAIAVGRCGDGIDYSAHDEKPVRVIAMISACNERPTEYLRLLSTVTRFVREQYRSILDADAVADMYGTLAHYSFEA